MDDNVAVRLGDSLDMDEGIAIAVEAEDRDARAVGVQSTAVLPAAREALQVHDCSSWNRLKKVQPSSQARAQHLQQYYL